MPSNKTIVEKAVADFLRSLRERNASPHTIKAYTGDLAISPPTLAPATGATSTTSPSADFSPIFTKKD